MFRFFAVVWAISGISGLLGYALFRLSYPVFDLYNYSLGFLEIVALVFYTAFMAYYEGYKGFQKGFSPRVAARVNYLKHNANWINGFLAPLFCMGYFGTTRKRQITVYLLTIGLWVLIVLVRTIPQPWRGIIDVGVIVGLTWGLLSFYYYTYLALTSDVFAFSPELKISKN